MKWYATMKNILKSIEDHYVTLYESLGSSFLHVFDLIKSYEWKTFLENSKVCLP